MSSPQRWPNVDSYQLYILNPKRWIKDPRLHSTQVEFKPGTKTPRVRSGNFGCVYRFSDQRNAFAVKVFTKAQTERERRYELISQYLAYSPPSPHLVSFKFWPQGIFCDGWRPALVMDWVNGHSLDNYLGEVFRNGPGQWSNGVLCQEWAALVQGLAQRHIAHGDLQSGNILVLHDAQGGLQLKLIDYDGMFVPGMERVGLQQPECGLPAFQHPKRGHTRQFFNERLDDFSALVILLSLASVDANLWRQYNHNNDQCLILREADLAAPDRSELLGKLSSSPDSAVRNLASIVRAAAKGSLNDVPRFATILQDSSIRQILTPSWRPSPLKTDIDVEPAVRCARCKAAPRPSDSYCRSCGEPIKPVNGESFKVIDRRLSTTDGELRKEFTEQERHEKEIATALPKPGPSPEPQTDDAAAKWRAMLVTIMACGIIVLVIWLPELVKEGITGTQIVELLIAILALFFTTRALLNSRLKRK